jgi:predicted RecA/RadA family phage recombinase
MKNFIQTGDTLTVIAPANVLSGQAVLVGALFGIASNDALQGTPVEIKRTGVYSLVAATADTGAIGAKIYWDNTNKRLTTTATNNALVGALATPKGGTETIAAVLLDGVIR